jgi:hypothetical protein
MPKLVSERVKGYTLFLRARVRKSVSLDIVED